MFKIKQLLILIIFIVTQVFTLSCNKTIDEDEEQGNIAMVNRHITYKGENFTGTLVKKYPETSQLEYKREIKDGLIHGKQLTYYKNGQQKEDFEALYGVKNGVYLSYWENGKIQSKKNYVFNDYDGVNENYYESGVLHSISKFSNKKLIEDISYDMDGKLTQKYFVKGDSSIREDYEKGKVVHRIINGVSVN
jgi:antitoxin component YwqK of YwqJK toxin-antitoxin module